LTNVLWPLSKKLIDFEDDFFNDWAKVLYHFKMGSKKGFKYKNQLLGTIAGKRVSNSMTQNNKEQLTDAFVIATDGIQQNYWRQYI
jgi:hypothetical protein